MWLLILLLLAFMASSSACPDLCECHRIEKDDVTDLIEVSCTGKVPLPYSLPPGTRRLKIDSADELKVTNMLGKFDNVSQALPYLNELVVTNCSIGTLDDLWTEFEYNVRVLNLSCNNVVDLSDVQIFRNLSSLRVFDVSNNFLSNVSAEAFRTLPTLIWLSLRRNDIEYVNKDAFRGLDVLQNLDLSDNRLVSLPDSALTPLRSLQKLDLSGNQLQVLGARWFESLGRLRELDVSRNGLARAASGALQPLPGLSILRLAGNPLEERDVSLLLGTGRRLETVDASRTGLARVPAVLTRSVRALRLAGNKLTSIRGGDLDSYPLLRLLDISDNRLIVVEEDALGRLEVLEELNLSGNILTAVPRSLPNSLMLLNLKGNGITNLRFNDLQGLYNLRSLLLNDNSISEIYEGSLRHLPALIQLDISNNPIKILPANTLNGPTNLATLHMSGLTLLEWNQQEQGDMAFPVPTPERLVTLDVSYSPVLAAQFLADNAALSACKSMLTLNLMSTNITTIRSDLTYFLSQLRSLGLAGNNWNCTEDLYWLGKWLRQHEELQPYAQCVEPVSMTGLHLCKMPTPLQITTTSTMIDHVINSTSKLSLEVTEYFNEPNASMSSYVAGINTQDGTRDSNEGALNADATEYSITYANFKIKASTNVLYESSTISGLHDTRLLKTSSTLHFINVSKITPPFSQLKQNISQNAMLEKKNSNDKANENKVDYENVMNHNQLSNLINNGRGLRSNKSHGSITNNNDSQSVFNKVNVKRQKNAKFTNKSVPMNVTKQNSTSLNKTFLDAIRSKATGSHPEERIKRRHFKGSAANLTSTIFLDDAPMNTVAEELSGQATDSGARVSEPLFTGTHPGMLVLAGAALGAAVVLTVVLSRHATVRRRDRYHRHENIEIHTLTMAATELW